MPERMTRPAERVRLAGLRDSPLDVDEVHRLLADPSAGGVTVFVGAVREQDQGRSVKSLEYEAHPSAETQLRRVTMEVAERGDLLAVAAVHRVGELRIGDVAVVVGAAAGHRDAAFAGCRELIDRIKAEVPIWKHQVFTDGSQEWVGTP